MILASTVVTGTGVMAQVPTVQRLPSAAASLGRETADFMQRERTQLCNRVGVNDGGGICASIRSSQSSLRSNTQ